MAEYKQYISQAEENGNVLISEDVVAAIAEHAVSEVADLIGKNWGRGLKIQIAEDNSVAIDMDILIHYGYSVVDVADAVQTAVASAVESMTGVKVTAVNINVSGISRK